MPLLDAAGISGTDTTGCGGFINLPAGLTGLFHIINGDVLELDRRMGTIIVNTRPDAVTITRLVPIGR